MLGWSFSIGRVFGVAVRLHAFFLLLLLLCVTWSAAIGRSIGRGLMLWMLILGAVLVREAARAMAAAWFRLDLRNVVLLPTGGIQAYSNTDSQTRAAGARVQKRMALVGPVASFVFGITLAGLILTVAPHVDLVGPRWVTPAHLLRSMVWLNLLLGAVNLLPAWPMDGGRVLRTTEFGKPRAGSVTTEPAKATGDLKAKPVYGPLSRLGRSAILFQGSQGSGIFSSLGPAIAVFLIVFGLLSVNWWLVVFGIGILVAAQIERQGLQVQVGLDLVLVRDVMLTEFSVLSASATLEDALEHARHSLQDVFPVVRGNTVVGAIARHTILESLTGSGNGFVQGVMSRTFQTASSMEALPAALARIPGQSAQIVPIVEGDRIVGILTPQNLSRSMSILPRRAAGSDGRAGFSRDADSDR